MENCIIRLAKTEDSEAVERIMRQVHAMHVAWRPDLYCMPERVLPQEEYETAVAQESLLVAEKSGEVVGMLQYQMRHSEGTGRVTHDILWVHAVAVDEAHRGQGIGTRLLDAAREMARRRGVGRIGLGVNGCNERARKLYARYGFAERSVNMDMEV